MPFYANSQPLLGAIQMQKLSVLNTYIQARIDCKPHAPKICSIKNEVNILSQPIAIFNNFIISKYTF